MNDEEVAYYRVVEDEFARQRGTPFLFTPKDFAYLRRWWAEGVPLAAVLAGIGEVFARRRESGEAPVSSLSYCRHAVNRHGKRLRQAAVGGSDGEVRIDVPAFLRGLAGEVGGAADAWRHVPGVAAVLDHLRAAIVSVPADAPPGALDETLARLETDAVDAAGAALPAAERAAVESEVDAAVDGLMSEPDVMVRTRRAVRFRALRALLKIPRLELPLGE